MAREMVRCGMANVAHTPRAPTQKRQEQYIRERESIANVTLNAM